MAIDKRQSWLIAAIVFLTVLSSSLTACFTEKEKYILSPASNIDDKTEEHGKIENVAKEEIVVHIKGEINKPGIYKMHRELRLYELVEAAGGLTDKADIRRINLAVILEDEEAIYIPAIGEAVPEVKEGAAGNSSADGKIRINYATKAELMELQGIGNALADRIIEYRNTKGSFESIEEIMNVSGIGESKYEGIKDKITVK